MVDQDIIATGIDWFRQFITDADLESRKEIIQEYLESAVRPNDGNFTRITYEEDIFIWYFLLAELYISGSVSYDFFQGSRAVPYFKAIGKQVHLLDAVQGIEERAKKIVQKGGDHPDTGIFEILTAACYRRNGYRDVAFIPEGRCKTPDIFARKDHDVYIECKRLTRTSQYSINEREKWFSLWGPVGKFLANNRVSLFFKITFKKELKDLQDSYLEEKLIPKIQFIPTSYRSTPIDDDIILVECFPIDYERIKNYLKNFYLRQNSPQFINILLGEYEQFGNYRLIIEARPVYNNPLLIEDVKFVAGASWKCISKDAINIKSRHIKKRLADALDQMPKDDFGIIHLGIEALEGDEIEQLRLLKSHIEIGNFDFKSKPVQWIYYHILSPGVNHEDDWTFEETVTRYTYDGAKVPVLDDPSLMPFDETHEGFAWDFFR